MFVTSDTHSPCVCVMFIIQAIWQEFCHHYSLDAISTLVPDLAQHLPTTVRTSLRSRPVLQLLTCHRTLSTGCGLGLELGLGLRLRLGFELGLGLGLGLGLVLGWGLGVRFESRCDHVAY